MLSNLGKAAVAKKQTQKYKDDEIRQGTSSRPGGGSFS